MFQKVHARTSNDTLLNPMYTSLKAGAQKKGIDPQYWDDNLDEGVKQA